MTQIEALARAEQLTERWLNGNKASVYEVLNQAHATILAILIMQNLNANERAGFVNYMLERKCNRF